MHRDIKSLNIFLKGANQIKLGDFGLAKQYKNDHKIPIEKANNKNFELTSSRQVGTPFYLAPELFSPEGKYSPKSDIWAMGVILYELICLKYPFQGKDFDDLKQKILHDQFNPIKNFGNKVSTELVDLANRMLNKVASERPSTTEILQMKVIRKHAGRFGISLP